MTSSSWESEPDWMDGGSTTYSPPAPPNSLAYAIRKEKDLRGVVDMGSNGIRFSVTDLSPPHARILPTVHVYRVDISLYDAQFDPETGKQIPIPKDVISHVVAAIVRFKIVCKDLGVSESNITVVATEATRAALNSAEFLGAIHLATGLSVTVLQKEDEGRIGALGVASGFSGIRGLMMDLGGGSTQITWIMMAPGSGNVRISPKGSISFPYGAAALTRLIEHAREGKKSKRDAEKAVEELRQEITAKFKAAYSDLEVPEALETMARLDGGFPLYVSGGGFRGWGYILLHMSQSQTNTATTGCRSRPPPRPAYPISIINGYTVARDQFDDTAAVERVAHAAHSVFRVSDRRRAQVPAVAFLIQAVSQAIPHGGIRTAHFCQGGVREGVLFQKLPPTVRSLDPLEVATSSFAPSSARAIASLLKFCVPEPGAVNNRIGASFPASAFSPHVIRAFANTLYVHASMGKESASTASLYSTSTGMIASVRGISHQDKARLALMLESRYMGELPPREVLFKTALIRCVVTPEEAWWAGYLGRVGYLISRLYPSGYVDESKPRVLLSAEWIMGDDPKLTMMGEKEEEEEQQQEDEEDEDKIAGGLRLIISIQKVENDPSKLKQALEEHVSIVEHVGKKKNWIDGWGMKVELKIVEEDIL